MTNVVKATLPGYDARTDPNPDHYSINSDADNVLIKRAFTGDAIVAIAGGLGYTIDTISHNLGYIPFFTVYASYLQLIDAWRLLNNQFNPFSVPPAICAVDTNNLYVVNFQAVTLPYGYDIFYDDMDQNGSPIITESDQVIKVMRPGKSAFSRNPNDALMHSDLNNFKILKQGKTTISLSAGDNTFAHGVTLTTPYKPFVFVKFPDGKTLLTGNATGYSYDETKWVEIAIDATNIHIRASGSFTVDVAYIIYGTAVAGSILTGDQIIAVTKAGFDARYETNPENFNFHSLYPTLKYYRSDEESLGSVTTTTVHTVAHNLNYVPFFIGFVNDLNDFNIFNGNSETVFAIAPYYLGRSTIPSPNKDVAAYVYADSTNLYFKAYYQTNAIGTNFTFDFFYKLFRNNLNL